ncbi:hypothetical protein MMC25_005654 [Agyrium rufum]|nr:hypothetical protein [Agyrium rufum]
MGPPPVPKPHSTKPTNMMSPPSEVEDRPKKKMRKGTHSCISCRRRKIRCVFLPDASICNDCQSRSVPCVDQESADPNVFTGPRKKRPSTHSTHSTSQQESVTSRMSEKSDSPTRSPMEIGAAEALRNLQSELLSSKSKSLQAQYQTDPVSSDNPAENAEDSFSADLENRAPLLSIFNNAIITRGDDEFAQGESNKQARPKLSRKSKLILHALRALAPSERDLDIILNAGQEWRDLWIKSFPGSTMIDINEVGGHNDAETLKNHICVSLMSDNVGVIAKILCCLAVCMQQLPPDFGKDSLSLPASLHDLQEHYMTAVETLLSDEDFAGTLEGLECTALQTKYLVNLGKPRKAWLILRRSVSYAQILGCHRQNATNLTTAIGRRKRAAWTQIWQADRHLSLILGLPYAVPDSQINWDPSDVGNASFGGMPQAKLVSRLSIIAGHVIDCTQSGGDAQYADIMKVEQELEEAKKLLPDTWWTATTTQETSISDIYDMFMSRIMLNNVRKLAHLPFMLKSYTDRRYDYSRFACLESSREMIAAYQVLRSDVRAILNTCNLIDFIVFTAAMIVVLDLFSHSAPTSRHDPVDEQRDWLIIESVAQDFARLETDTNCSVVAKQASRLLSNILDARVYGCPADEAGCEALIPYFGKIKIMPGKNFQHGVTKPFGSVDLPSRSTSATPGWSTASVSSTGMTAQMHTPGTTSVGSSRGSVCGGMPNLNPPSGSLGPSLEDPTQHQQQQQLNQQQQQQQVQFGAGAGGGGAGGDLPYVDPLIRFDFDGYLQTLDGSNLYNPGMNPGAGMDWSGLVSHDLNTDWNWMVSGQGADTSAV